MSSSERTIGLATLGLAIAAVGTFLPWSRIGGRNRSGYDTADTFISLATGALPDVVAWFGRWWYVPAFLSVLLWALAFLAGSRTVRISAVFLGTCALVMWWLVIWACKHYGVLNVKLIGPMVSSAGVLLLTAAAATRRAAAFGSRIQ